MIESTYEECMSYDPDTDCPTPSGNENLNSFEIKITDGVRPYEYVFKIKAIARGDNYYWTDYLSLIISCPNSYTIIPSSLEDPYTEERTYSV